LCWCALEPLPRIWRNDFSLALLGGAEDVLYQDATPIGIAPLFTMDLSVSVVLPDALLPIIRPIENLLPGLLKPRTLFIGSPCWDEGTSVSCRT
jgi:hypothetical protein